MKNYQKGLIALGAAHFEEVIQFYEKLFGTKPADAIGQSYVEFNVAGLRLGIFKPREHNVEKFENKSREGHGLSICFQLQNLDELIAECRAKGFEITDPIPTKHGREAFLYDPQHNRLIFSQMREGE